MSMETRVENKPRAKFRGARRAPIYQQLYDLQSMHSQQRLLDAQGDERINARGTARGKIASQERDTHQQQCDANINEWIGGAHAVEQAPGHAGDGQRDQYAYG